MSDEGARDDRLPRDRATPSSRAWCRRTASGPQDFDRRARLRRARLHAAPADRGSLPVDADGSCRASWRCCSAGRTAEEIAFGEITTGAQNDLQRATDIARAMVTEYGMSEALGADQLRRQQAAAIPRHRHSAGARPLLRRDGAEDRRRDQADPLRGARHRTDGPHRPARRARYDRAPPARGGSDRRRRAAPDPRTRAAARSAAGGLSSLQNLRAGIAITSGAQCSCRSCVQFTYKRERCQRRVAKRRVDQEASHPWQHRTDANINGTLDPRPSVRVGNNWTGLLAVNPGFRSIEAAINPPSGERKNNSRTVMPPDWLNATRQRHMHLA